MKLYRILLASALMLGMTLTASATGPVRRTSVHRQADGTELTVTRLGNGRYTLYTTADNRAILPAADGDYYYAQRQADGTIGPSTVPARNAFSARAAQSGFLTTEQMREALEQLNPQTPIIHTTNARSLGTSTPDGLGKYGVSALGAVNSIGEQRIPVVMVEFSDVAFQDSIDATKLSRMLNESGYRDERAARGSARDFFIAQSDSLFRPTFDVVARVTLPNTREYYGADGSNASTDPHITYFVRDALSQASSAVDFSAYRTSGTTRVPLVILYFAGPGQQSSFEDGCSNYLWAKFQQSTFSVNNGASSVQSYLVANELLQNYSGTQDAPVIESAGIDGIGLVAHEFCHALGLPDYYNTSTGATTMGYWDLMDYGQYYQNGYRPVELTGHERSYLGWLEVQELGETPCACTLLPLDGSKTGNGARAYVVRNQQCNTEYYFLENRQKNTWHTSTMGAGMLVTHVDYSSSAWSTNSANNGSHLRMAYVPADNTTNGISGGMELFEGYRNDLFPYTDADGTVHNSLTDTTVPAATVFNQTTYLSRPIYDIAMDNDGIITFSYLNGGLTGVEAATISPNAAAAPVYDLNGRRIGSLESAAPGVYIRGGKKVIKK